MIKLRNGLHKLEEGILCMFLLAMIFIACMQIVLRGPFSGGFLWADPLLRYLVLWSGMLGAAVATRKGKHIAIDVASYLVPENMKPWLGIGIDFFSFLVSLGLTWASVIFVRNEAEFGGISLLSVPPWIWNLVFPLAFGLICLRYLAAFLSGLYCLMTPKKVAE